MLYIQWKPSEIEFVQISAIFLIQQNFCLHIIPNHKPKPLSTMSEAQNNPKTATAPITRSDNPNKTVGGKENVGQGFPGESNLTHQDRFEADHQVGLSGISGTANAVGKPFDKDGVLGHQFTGGSVGGAAQDKIAGVKKN